jgi:hypothetical protein
VRRPFVSSLLVAGLLAVGSLAFQSAPASAVFDHSEVIREIAVGSECAGPFGGVINDVAVDEANGWLYVACNGQVRRFTLAGKPADFEAVAPYISGNVLTYDPDGEENKFANRTNLAVDNSDSINQGRLFATSSPNLEIFNPSGKYFTNITQPLESSISNYLEALEVGPDGSIYLGSQAPGGRVSKYNPQLREVKRLYSTSSEGKTPCNLSIDSTGAVWLDRCETFFNYQRGLYKYEADQFTDETALTPFGTSPSQIEPFVAKPSPYLANVPLLEELGQVSVDLNTDDVYVNQRNHIEVYSRGTAEDPSYQDAPAFGSAFLGGESFAIAVTKNNDVYASYGSEKVIVFGPGKILPNLHTRAADINEVGHTSASVKGVVERAGGSKIINCKFQYGLNATYLGAGSGSVPCSSTTFEDGSKEVGATLPLPETGQVYHYRVAATNVEGENFGIDRTVTPAFVLKLQTQPVADLSTEGAELRGSLDPDGLPTKYFFEYGVNSSYGLKTSLSAGGSGTGVTEVGTALDNLPSGKVFHYRIVAENDNGTTVGVDRTFRTGSSPVVSGTKAAEIGETSATLSANINPVGFETEYKIEYGSTPDYGNSVPVAPVSIGSGTEALEVTQAVSGLRPETTQHFRVVATNQWGTTFSPDTTFDYAPPTCPNDHVRQQSGASYLPDCRAYELVSPPAAGAVVLFPSEEVAESGEGLEGSGNNTYNHGVQYIVNRGFASSPSRFSFYGGQGAINGIYSPSSEADMYMATRTASGWITTLPGLDGHQVYRSGRKECSESMALCIDHSEEEYVGFHSEFAPYLFAADGSSRGRLPTNLGVIPEGAKFRGWQRMSGDFSHFVFSSSAPGSGYFESNGVAVPFAPGGLVTGVGSAYDNDIASRTVKLISKLPNGEDIPTLVPATYGPAIGFAGVSPDGSHILMSTYGGPGLKYLYMSINDLLVLPIGLKEGTEPGAEPEQLAVEPIGMTRNGSKVIFASNQQVTAEDKDSSRDIYSWSEVTERITLLTQGNGNGNTDECTAAWTAGCNAQVVTPERMHPNNNQGISVPTAEDDQYAEEAGDVFFYSPELLDQQKPGILNQRNLYDSREGSVHLVATLDPGTTVDRLQISPDGRFAALLTKSRLTSYDSQGRREMYTFNVESGVLECASCNPDGQPPGSDVRASEGGRFMADDGRAFFTTSDALVPRDRDGKISDVYEYVGGRPQLITSGLGARDYTGGSSVIKLFSHPQFTGLEAVSHSGQDVYFSTFETLVPRDHNGEFVKFYDARTGGGFDESPALAPCEAADECHGEDSSAPVPATVASGATVPGGNAQQPAKKKPKKKQKKKKHHRRSHRGHHHG